VFDPARVSYEQLLETFWRITIRPPANRPGLGFRRPVPVGDLVTTPTRRRSPLLTDSRTGVLRRPIVTEITRRRRSTRRGLHQQYSRSRAARRARSRSGSEPRLALFEPQVRAREGAQLHPPRCSRLLNAACRTPTTAARLLGREALDVAQHDGGTPLRGELRQCSWRTASNSRSIARASGRDAGPRGSRRPDRRRPDRALPRRPRLDRRRWAS